MKVIHLALSSAPVGVPTAHPRLDAESDTVSVRNLLQTPHRAGTAGMADATRLLWLAAMMRAALLAWGLIQDVTLPVPYTDVDYDVFTDAARFMSRGESPYERSTYRYSPLLALVPNAVVHPLWGKTLFVMGDLFAGVLIARLARLRGADERATAFATAVRMRRDYLGFASHG